MRLKKCPCRWVDSVRDAFSPGLAAVAAVVAASWLGSVDAQTPPAAQGAPSSAAYAPTLETQKQARTWYFTIPAPRGQISDREGRPMALQKVAYNLAVSFPRPLNLSDPDVVEFVDAEANKAAKLLNRQASLSQESVIRHYRSRGLMPLVIMQNLTEQEQEKIRAAQNPAWELFPLYLRVYPNGTLAGHILGYVGRMGRFLEGAIENGEPLWPDTEGRDGLEKTFDSILRGESGQLNVIYNSAGLKSSEQVTITPLAGKNVVTTIDLELQKMCERALQAGTKRGAMVIMDPSNGDILAMASWPPIDPNKFVPTISESDYNALKKDKNEPLFPRFSLASYPPGSTFKCFVGLAALSAGVIRPEDHFNCPPALQIGDHLFHNWKKEERGQLNFAEALEQSCNTWFYQVGMKMGGKLITDCAENVGFGDKTGVPLPEENPGLIPTDEYLRAKHGVRLNGGQLAMLAIGQGATEITPLQMAQGMSVIANGGVLYQARLVKQVQDVTGEVVNAYDVRARRRIEISPEAMSALRLGMTQVVTGGRGTAHQASVDKVTVAGKTGTAQWRSSSTVAWFAGFAPAEGPRLAFAVVYEGDPNRNDVHGGSHAAPMIGKVLKEYFKDVEKAKPAKFQDASGNEIDFKPRVTTPPPKAVPIEPVDQETAPQEPTPAPAKTPFWKRLFG
jgi:penicillin-binding protein 2